MYRRPAKTAPAVGDLAAQVIARYTTLVPSGPSVRICGPSAVIATVCSKCAAIEPSTVKIDQPSLVEADVVRAGGDHRLDREHHALLQLRAAAGRAEVRDLRVLVHPPADAVPDELADDAEALALDVRLAGVAEVEQAVADLALRDHPAQRLLADGEQPERLGRHLAHATVTAESPTKPRWVTPTSSDRMSPSRQHVRSPGMPCTIMSFGDEQIEPGKPR